MYVVRGTAVSFSPFGVGKPKLQMSRINRFKYQRAEPSIQMPGQSGFFRWNLKNMKQIPASTSTAVDSGGPTPVFSAFVPGSSWAQGKILMIRGWYDFIIPAGPFPPTYDVQEGIISSQSALHAFLGLPPFLPIAGQSRNWIQRDIIRIDPDLWYFDIGETSVNSFANSYQNLQYVAPMGATAPPYDFSQPIQIDLTFDMIGGIAGAQIVGRFVEAFLEQGTNLGALS